MTVNLSVDKKALLLFVLIAAALYAPYRAYYFGYTKGYRVAITKIMAILEQEESRPKTSDDETYNGSRK